MSTPGPRPLPFDPPPAGRRGDRRLASGLSALGLVALLGATIAVSLAGCSRQPRFVPASADSSRAAAADSLDDQVRRLQERWSTPGAGEEAARLTAQVLLQDLNARVAADPLASWAERARTLLDSLDVGAELVSARGALGVNFFERSDPTAGSWPWIYWRGVSAVQTQAVEGVGMSLVGLASRGLSDAPAAAPAAGARPQGIAALFARRSGFGQQPLLLSWRIAGVRLVLAQTLGPDSLGGVGTGAFESPADTAVLLSTRTWRPTPRFDECATCPHLYHQRRFRWGLEGFARVEDVLVPTPYVTFVHLIQALLAGDQDGALQLVTNPAVLESAHDAGWAVARGPWRPAPGGDTVGDELIFYRGASEAWKVHFVRQGGTWRVDAIEATSRVIE